MSSGPDASISSIVFVNVGASALFVIGRGPYLGPETDPTPLPGYLAARFLPLLDTIRAPIRMTAMTPICLALLAGGGFSVVERLSRERLSRGWARAWLLLPLPLILLWPTLPAEMGAPISMRPEDRALADELAKLPASSVILSLPMDLEPSGAAVDQRVLVHRRAQRFLNNIRYRDTLVQRLLDQGLHLAMFSREYSLIHFS